MQQKTVKISLFRPIPDRRSKGAFLAGEGKTIKTRTRRSTHPVLED